MYIILPLYVLQKAKFILADFIDLKKIHVVKSETIRPGVYATPYDMSVWNRQKMTTAYSSMSKDTVHYPKLIAPDTIDFPVT